MGATVTVNDLLDGHVVLDLESLDRIYLNGYVPSLQVGGQVVSFMTRHLGLPIPSPAVLEKIATKFRRRVDSFAQANEIPVVKFHRGDRKVEVMRRYLDARARSGRSGVAAIGVAQENQNVFAANERDRSTGVPWFSFTKADRRVTCFYVYLWDEDFGPGFIKICAYFPYPIKVWVNGHEWVKRQATAAGIGYPELSNGLAACDDPEALQALCDRLGPGTIDVFFQSWLARLPLALALDEADRTDGYWWELSMRQIEVSRTIVFDAPRREVNAGERDLGVADQPLLGFVPDRVRVADRGPRVLVDARDRPHDSGVHPGGDGEPRAAATGGGDHVVAVVGGVRADDHQPAPTAGLGGGQGVGDQPRRGPSWSSLYAAGSRRSPARTAAWTPWRSRRSTPSPRCSRTRRPACDIRGWP